MSNPPTNYPSNGTGFPARTELPPASALIQPLPPVTTIAEPQSQQPQPDSSSPGFRPLNVRDALTYLEMVRVQFGDQPEVYSRFLDIMKDFKSHAIDTPGVIERVSSLFRAHPALIHGFNTFLPPGYSLEATNNPADPVRVISPSSRPQYYQPSGSAPSYAPSFPESHQGTRTTPPSTSITEPPKQRSPEYTPALPPMTNIGIGSQPQFSSQAQVQNATPTAPAEAVKSEATAVPGPSRQRGPIEFNYAINYVNKIKTRYANEPEVYRQFLEILQAYQREQRPIQEVYTQVQVLFRGAADLLEEFQQFLPDTSSPAQGQAQYAGGQGASSKPAAVRKPPRRAGPVNPPIAYTGPPPSQTLPPPKKKPRVAKPDKPGSMEELEFFEKCKRVIGNKTSYAEFLKILNLFSQEIIEAKVLIERVEPFLSKAPELFDWFKRFVKYEDDDVIYNIPADRPDLDLRTCRRSGHSYRKLPRHIPRPICSGRDELCKDVLSDDWISHPVYVSETGFVAHKKTLYEEAMYKCEEERYEFDLNIEANLHVISLLEPIAKKIALMTPEEKEKFKLSPGLGGTSVAIYSRVIKKIYDNARGQEVIDALYENPSIVLPIVLKRLKQKDEEWKRSRREWCKVWKEIDTKNFAKALDHQGIHFKTADRKVINVKSLLTEIEVLHREQREKRSTLANRYQFDFIFEKNRIFDDCYTILTSYIESSLGLSSSDEEKSMNILNDFIPLFFFLKEDNIDAMEVDTNEAEGGGRKRNTFSFYANTALYAFFRLYQMLFSRLYKMHQLSDSMHNEVPRSETVNPVAQDLGLVKGTVKAFAEESRYAELLKLIQSFLSNDLDSNDFEDRVRTIYWTDGYLIFTVDKIVQAIGKQLQAIVADNRSLELINIYKKDREKNSTSSRQEALYRLCAESIAQEDNLFRLEFFVSERVLTIQLLGREDHITDDSISSEEKWSLYVDQFVQLSATEGIALKRKDPFLKRNLPTDVGDDPPTNVETISGLELKICVNTYKIFFVDNTEDYFRRKRTKGINNSSIDQKRSEKFNLWLNSSKGYQHGLDEESIKKADEEYANWINS